MPGDGSRRLSVAKIAEIRQRAANGESYPSIARAMGCSIGTAHYHATHADALAKRREYVEGKWARKYRCGICHEEGHNARACGATSVRECISAETTTRPTGAGEEK